MLSLPRHPRQHQQCKTKHQLAPLGTSQPRGHNVPQHQGGARLCMEHHSKPQGAGVPSCDSHTGPANQALSKEVTTCISIHRLGPVLTPPGITKQGLETSLLGSRNTRAMGEKLGQHCYMYPLILQARHTGDKTWKSISGEEMSKPCYGLDLSKQPLWAQNPSAKTRHLEGCL